MRDGALDIGDALARRLKLRLAAGLLLARGAHRLERRARGAVRFGEARFADARASDAVAARRLGLFDASISARRCCRKASGASASRSCSACAVFEPLLQLADAVLRLVAPFRP